MADLTPFATGFFTGKPVTGISPRFLAQVEQAVRAAGGTSVVVTSGKRPPGPGNDVKNSNHITGDALDGYAVINNMQVPIGQALLPHAQRFGLRSGAVAGFDPKTPGGFDPIHVDDGANVGLTKPFGTSASLPQFDPAHPDARASGQVGGALYGDQLLSQINQSAQQYRVDPSVLLAVAPHEGGFQGAVGDQGTSFGPWQLHAGGALPAQVWSQGADYAKKWANSPAGINYAVQKIASTLHGRTGADAVKAVVTDFERPASQYVPGEISKALASYGQGAPAIPPMPSPLTPASQVPGGLPPQLGQVAPKKPANTALPLKLALQLLGVKPSGIV